jgi:hypothetical protein
MNEPDTETGWFSRSGAEARNPSASREKRPVISTSETEAMVRADGPP